MKDCSQYSWCPSWDSNRAPTEYMSRELSVDQTDLLKLWEMLAYFLIIMNKQEHSQQKCCIKYEYYHIFSTFHILWSVITLQTFALPTTRRFWSLLWSRNHIQRVYRSFKIHSLEVWRKTTLKQFPFWIDIVRLIIFVMEDF
jgi:hypothetical protein